MAKAEQREMDAKIADSIAENSECGQKEHDDRWCADCDRISIGADKVAARIREGK